MDDGKTIAYSEAIGWLSKLGGRLTSLVNSKTAPPPNRMPGTLRDVDFKSLPTIDYTLELKLAQVYASNALSLCLPQHVDLLLTNLETELVTKNETHRGKEKLTIGAKNETPMANATTVNSSCSLEKLLPRTSNAWLGVARVPKTSPPKAKMRLVLSKSVG